ncbi:IS5/IS1182 family transposase [Lactiplantibacillus plantarum]|uniref:IS5 family transposase n=1 Tax=Lactiplantibacillus plantarum TaxID=1590 RepID=UPI000B4DD77B|nr:IS5 family transposase [Lactiplantibacillus plantarum]ASD33466.1 IS5/IS1182 family transposase [Lactiplantibacillus plantarum]
MTTPKRYELEDAQWDRIKGYFPPYRTGRPSSLDNRTALNAILWLMRSGAPWRDLPERYGSWKTVYSRFRVWADAGLFEKLFRQLIDDPDLENVSLDSTSIRVHQKATGAKKNARCLVENQAIGLSRGGRTTKIHAVVDGLGNPLRFILTGGQVHDSQVASELLEGFDISQSNIIADKAYGTAKLRQYIEDKAGVYTIPPKENTKDKWTCDYHVYCERHLIENFFNQLKNFRRIATRYDKLAHVYLATVYIASICILLK